MASDWITTEEASEISGYHPHHIRRLLWSGDVKGQKWGQQWQVSRISLLAYVRSMERLGEKRGPKSDEPDEIPV